MSSSRASRRFRFLRFLARFNSVCNENDISEQASLILLPKWLTGEAYNNHAQHRDRGSGRDRHIRTYLEVVHFLLGDYAKDSVIEGAVADFEGTRQEDNEDKKTNASRLKKKSEICEDVYSDEELATRYLLGLKPGTKPIILAERQKNPDVPFREQVDQPKQREMHIGLSKG